MAEQTTELTIGQEHEFDIGRAGPVGTLCNGFIVNVGIIISITFKTYLKNFSIQSFINVCPNVLCSNIVLNRELEADNTTL